MSEISFLVALTSADNSISQLAAKGLRLVSYAERQPGAPLNPTVTEEDRSKKYPIYEQLGDPRITVVGKLNFPIDNKVFSLIFSLFNSQVVWVIRSEFGNWFAS